MDKDLLCYAQKPERLPCFPKKDLLFINVNFGSDYADSKDPTNRCNGLEARIAAEIVKVASEYSKTKANPIRLGISTFFSSQKSLLESILRELGLLCDDIKVKLVDEMFGEVRHNSRSSILMCK